MKYFTKSLSALYKMFFSAFASGALEDAKMELHATESALLQAETVREDYNSKVLVYRARIDRLKQYISDRETQPEQFPILHDRRVDASKTPVISHRNGHTPNLGMGHSPRPVEPATSHLNH